jgi:hypothetical protein
MSAQVAHASPAAHAPRPGGIRAPTKEELTALYANIVRDAEQNPIRSLRPTKLRRAPVGFSSAPKFPLPQTKKGRSQTVYVIRGTLYLETKLSSPNAKATWAKVGRAPVF